MKRLGLLLSLILIASQLVACATRQAKSVVC